MRAQPWYPRVKATFDKAGVDEAVWMGTIRAEDPSLAPYKENYNPSTGDDSWGLFQVNLYGDLASDPARQYAAHGGPDANAAWAANIMGPAIDRIGGRSAGLQAETDAVVEAAWPGKGSPPSVHAQRQALVGQTAKELGMKPDLSTNQDGSSATTQAPPVGSWGWWFPGTTKPQPSWFPSVPDPKGIAQGIGWWAIIAVVILGGFLLLAFSLNPEANLVAAATKANSA